MVAPRVTPVPEITCPTASVGGLDPETVRVVPEIDPVKLGTEGRTTVTGSLNFTRTETS